LGQTRDPHVVPFASGDIPRYATYSSYENEDGQRLKDRTDLSDDASREVKANVNMFASVDKYYNTIATFGGDGPTIHDLEYIHPKIWVLKRNDVP